MPSSTDVVPRLLHEVNIHLLDGQDHDVAKNTSARSYVKLSKEESFLLQNFDGEATYEEVVSSFEEEFAEPLTCDELYGFVKMAQRRKLVKRSNDGATAAEAIEPTGLFGFFTRCYTNARRQSVFYFRIKLFDPDRILNWLEPKTRWSFSSYLAVVAAVAGVLAAIVIWSNRVELITLFTNQMGWETLVLFWLTIIVVTICHEFGHGLACKRYGGEVHEMGLLWIFLHTLHVLQCV